MKGGGRRTHDKEDVEKVWKKGDEKGTCDPLVFLPRFATDSSPRRLCGKKASSRKLPHRFTACLVPA